MCELTPRCSLQTPTYPQQEVLWWSSCWSHRVNGWIQRLAVNFHFRCFAAPRLWCEKKQFCKDIYLIRSKEEGVSLMNPPTVDLELAVVSFFAVLVSLSLDCGLFNLSASRFASVHPVSHWRYCTCVGVVWPGQALETKKHWSNSKNYSDLFLKSA